MKKIILFVLFLISIKITTANSTIVEIYSDGYSKIVHHLEIDSNNVDGLQKIKALNPESAIVRDSSQELKFSILNNIFLIEPKQKQKNYSITIQYLSNAFTVKSNEFWVFKYEPLIEEEKISVIFPLSTKLYDYSENATLFIFNGNMNLNWGKQKKIDVKYNIKNVEPNKIINYSFYFLISLIFILLMIYCSKIAYLKIKKIIPKAKQDIIKTLEKNEREVVKLLLNNNNKMSQSQIQKTTNISKATLSRVIKRLENKNLIEIRESGMTNLVMLQEWFVNKK